MKVLKRNYEHRNVLIFLILSLVYLQAITSLSRGDTLFSRQVLRAFINDHYLILFLSLVTGYMITTVKKYSEIILLICLSLIVGKNFVLLWGSFNKLTLVLNFIYLIFAFYFFISWELEVSMASFNPNFSEHDLEKESRWKIAAEISSQEDRSDAREVLVTNIDENSCFLLLPENNHSGLNPRKKYLLTAQYGGVSFRQWARLVSSYDRGVGLVFDEPIDTRVSWSELYKVCLERGIVG